MSSASYTWIEGSRVQLQPDFQKISIDGLQKIDVWLGSDLKPSEICNILEEKDKHRINVLLRFFLIEIFIT